MTKDDLVSKDTALKMAIEAMDTLMIEKGSIYQKALEACKEALEQPSVAELNDEYLRDTHVEGLSQPSQEPVALLEELSDLEHQQWIKWAQSIIDSEPISEARKQRWLTMMVDYKDLPDNIQEYDREWARKVMALYTHPTPSWQGNKEFVGLSDYEINDIKTKAIIGANGMSVEQLLGLIVSLTEQALKEKNT